MGGGKNNDKENWSEDEGISKEDQRRCDYKPCEFTKRRHHKVRRSSDIPDGFGEEKVKNHITVM